MPSFGAPNRMPTSVSRNKGFTRMPGNSVVLATDKERLKILSVSRTSIQLLLEAADNLAALPGMRDGAPRLGVINLYWGAERPLTWPGGDRPRAVALLLRAVCRHVGANPKTLVIDLKSLPVPSPVWVQLAAALRHTPSPSTGVDVHQLQQLRLAGCSLGNGGCRSVCRALCRLPHVGLVDLTDCDLDADAAPALGKLIRDHSVRRTNRHYDKCTAEWAATLHPVEGPGIKWCAAASSSSQQPGSPYTTDNPQHQRPVPSSKSGSVLDDGRPAGLSTLLLAHNRLGDSGAHALAPYIARDNFLATLDVSHNGVGPAAAAAIRTAAAYRHERGIGTRLELKADGIPGDRPLAAQREAAAEPDQARRERRGERRGRRRLPLGGGARQARPEGGGGVGQSVRRQAGGVRCARDDPHPERRGPPRPAQQEREGGMEQDAGDERADREGERDAVPPAARQAQLRVDEEAADVGAPVTVCARQPE